MQHQHFPFELLPHQANRLDKVGVIGDDDRRFILIVEPVHQEVGRDIDIRTLFLTLHHLDRLRSRRWRRMQRHAYRLFDVTAEVNRKVRNCPQGTR